MPPPAPKRVPRHKADPAQLDANRKYLIEALGQVEDASAVVPAIREALTELREFEAALDLMGRLEDTRRLAEWMRDEVGRACIALAPARSSEYSVPGGGVFKVRGGSERVKYDGEALIREAATRIGTALKLKGVVTADGEMGTPGPIISAIVSKVAALCGATAPSFKGWRSGIAKELGINLNDYAERENAPLKPSIEGRGTI